jgi:broad specificity phosphatase PhoE
LYRDSPLSPNGVRQAQELANSLSDLEKGHEINELDLIVVSPLTRALQTLEIGLLPHVLSGDETNQRSKVPIVALPHAAERLYLISDVGKTRQELHELYGHFVDFSFEEEEWWFTHDETVETYAEWRPDGRYACPGEPDELFDSRMTRLYNWIECRPESTIAVICHWGVIEWMIDQDFRNCEMRVVPFHEIKPKSLTVSTTRERSR